ncbi:transmembrane protein 14A isoform 1-T1 [Rhynochetos jubatus]
MAVDWVGFAYAALLAVGGVMGYTRKGSKISLAAGLTFASVTGYGAYCVTQDPRNVKISLFSAFLLTIVMGVRFKRSKKLMPAGLVACLRAASVGFACAIYGSDKEAHEIASSPVFLEWTSAACKPRIPAGNLAQL